MKRIWDLRLYNGKLAQPIPADKIAGMSRNTGGPAVAGDVYSVQPDGAVMAHDSADVRDWEVCQLDGVCLKYTVQGNVFIFAPEDL